MRKPDAHIGDAHAQIPLAQIAGGMLEIAQPGVRDDDRWPAVGPGPGDSTVASRQCFGGRAPVISDRNPIRMRECGELRVRGRVVSRAGRQRRRDANTPITPS